MRKDLCPFGLAFANRRKELGISLWQLCLALRYQPRNFQRIEAGQQEPRLSLALRMLRGLNIGFGPFLSGLASSTGIETNRASHVHTLDIALTGNENLPTVFGLLFKTARQQMGLTQQDIADKMDYHIRNLTKIENGLQEPRIITALNLISSTGYSIETFFNRLESFYKFE